MKVHFTVTFVPRRVTTDHHDIARLETVRVVSQVFRELATVLERHAFSFWDDPNVERFRATARQIDEARRPPPCFVRKRVEVELAPDAFAGCATRAPPRSTGALERVENEIDANLRHERPAFGVENVIEVIGELVA